MNKEEKISKKKRILLKKSFMYFFLIIISVIILDTIFNPKKDNINKSLYATTAVNTNKTLEKKETPQEFKKSCIYIPHKELARNTEKYIGKRVVYKGEVIQVLEEWNTTTMRVNVTYKEFYWDDTILVTKKGENKNPRVLEEDIIRVYGIVKGRTSYISILGAKITIPEIEAKYIEILKQ